MPPTRDYVVRMPKDTTVVSACQDVGCESWLHGWDTLIDEGAPLGRQQAAYIRRSSGRTFRELRGPDGLTVFRFEPHQRCFEEHRTRPARFLAAGYVHASMRDWVDDLGEHVIKIEDQKKRG